MTLKAFSGKLNGHWSVEGWAPALYATEQYGGAPEDIPQFAKLQRDVAAAMAHEADLLSGTDDDDRVNAEVVASVKHNRQNLSRHAMQMLRSTQVVHNYRGECRTISQAFLGGEDKSAPVGTGDCCATKLVSWLGHLDCVRLALQSFTTASVHERQPVCMRMFGMMPVNHDVNKSSALCFVA